MGNMYTFVHIDDPNKRAAANRARDEVEECLAREFVQLLKRAHVEGLLYALLKEAGWQGSRCGSGCEEARWSQAARTVMETMALPGAPVERGVRSMANE